MRVFIYEYVTGGGLLGQADEGPQLAELTSEGRAMLEALASDFARLPGSEVIALRDHRLPRFAPAGYVSQTVSAAEEERRQFEELAGNCDWTVVIAPECEGILLERCRAVEEAGGRLLGPSVDLVALASDKHATAEYLRAAGVPAPSGRLLAGNEPLPRDFKYPAIWKPRHGAGSLGVVYLESPEADRARSGPGRVEVFSWGQPVSIAFLCGPAGQYSLPPCEQRFAGAKDFAYRGGRLPLPQALAERAAALGRQAVAALPPARGYIGLDLVLSDQEDGRGDVVIEVNPRLTSSYVGLRAAAETNLAQAMLDAAEGSAPQLQFSGARIEFDTSGATRALSHSAAQA